MYVMTKSNLNDSNSSPMANITTYSSGIAQATAFRIIKKHTATALRPYDLTCMQWFTIGAAYEARNTGIRMSDLASALDTTQAYMTTVVNLLESRNILKKTVHGTDARTKLVYVTPQFRKQVPEIEAHVRTELRKLIYDDTITPQELFTYVSVLRKISKK